MIDPGIRGKVALVLQPRGSFRAGKIRGHGQRRLTRLYVGGGHAGNLVNYIFVFPGFLNLAQTQGPTDGTYFDLRNLPAQIPIKPRSSILIELVSPNFIPDSRGMMNATRNNNLIGNAKPTFESLEDRRLMSQVALVDGMLILQGNAHGHNRLTVSPDDNGTTVFARANKVKEHYLLKDIKTIIGLVRFLRNDRQWLRILNLKKRVDGIEVYSVPHRTRFYRFASRVGCEKMIEIFSRMVVELMRTGIIIIGRSVSLDATLISAWFKDCRVRKSEEHLKRCKHEKTK